MEPTDEAKLHFLDYWRVIRVRMPIIVLTFLLVVITAGIVVYFLPRKYVASVVMEVRDQANRLPIFNAGTGERMDPRFSSTQFQIMKTKEILYPVIDTLNLMEKWGPMYRLRNKDDAYRILERMIIVQERRNTDLIVISVVDTDAAEAADLANTIAAEYQKKRISEQLGNTQKSLTTLEDEVSKHRRKTEELRAEAARIRVESGIVDLHPDDVQDPMEAQSKILVEMEQQVSNERMKVEAIRVKLDKIKSLSDEEIMRSIETLEINDATITRIMPQYQELSAEEARLLNGGIGPNHPNIKALRAKTKEYQEQLKNQIAALRKTLQTNLDIAQNSLKSLESKLTETRDDRQSSNTRNVAYVEAKANYIQAKKLLETAEMRFSTQNMERVMPLTPAIIWEKAEAPLNYAYPRITLIIMVAIGMGALLGIGLAFFIEYLDTSVKTMEDVETYLGVPVLAIIPRNIALLINEPPDHPDAEAYRILRTNVEFNRKSPDANTLTVVSGGAGEGKSTTLNNLAYTFARGGYNTLVVDADLRRPGQHLHFNVSNEVGLTNYLTTDMPLEDVILPSHVENLYILPSGKLPLDAVGILNSQRMVEMISELKGRFDMVFFDSPPILGVSDASVLVSAVDLAIIVVQHRRFPRAMLHRVKQSILNVGGTILGVVLNNVDVRHDHHYEYYTSYYNYYNQPTRKTESSRSAKSLAPSPRKHVDEGGEY